MLTSRSPLGLDNGGGLVLVEPVAEVLLEQRSLTAFLDSGHVGPLRVALQLDEVVGIGEGRLLLLSSGPLAQPHIQGVGSGVYDERILADRKHCKHKEVERVDQLLCLVMLVCGVWRVTCVWSVQGDVCVECAG